MSAPKDGGPAYPVSPAHPVTHPNGEYEWLLPVGGMTMRQAYKIAALQGLLSSPTADGGSARKIVAEASAIADLALAEDEEHGRGGK